MTNPNSKIDSLTDEELMTIYQDGDEKAFNIIYRRHSGKVNGFLMNSLKNRMLADEVFQATFLKLHKSRHKYNPSLPFLAWLFTICKSVMIDTIRKKASVKEDYNLMALEQAEAPEVEQEKEIPDLSYLPEPQRKALELRYTKDFSFDEIALQLNTSPANVRQLISRAVKKMKAFYGGKVE